MQSTLGQKLGNKEQYKESFISLLSRHRVSCQVCLEMLHSLEEHTCMWQFHSDEILSVHLSHSCLSCLLLPTFSTIHQEGFLNQTANLMLQNHRVSQVGRDHRWLSGPTFLPKQGHPRACCTGLHPDGSGISTVGYCYRVKPAFHLS